MRSPKLIISSLAVILLIFLVSCSGQTERYNLNLEIPSNTETEDPSWEQEIFVENIIISSMDAVSTISKNEPIKLIVSGMNAKVTVQEGTPVQEIIISGMNAVVYLPKGSNPKIIQTGLNSEIVYY